MMGRRYGAMALAAAGLVLAAAGRADAQVTARVHVDWQWGADDHRVRDDYGYRVARLPRVGGYYADGYLYRPVVGIRIPRGHRPRAGFCRLWYPGVAPGHQPRAVPCHALRGLYRSGVLIVTHQGVLRPVWDGYASRYWTGYRDVRMVWRDDYRYYDWDDRRYDDRDYRRYYDRDGDWWDDDGRYRGSAYKAPARVVPPPTRVHGERYGDRGDRYERDDRRDREGARGDRQDRESWKGNDGRSGPGVGRGNGRGNGRGRGGGGR